MSSSSKASKVFDIPGQLRFNLKPRNGKAALTAIEIAKISDYFKTSGVIFALTELADFCDQNGVLIPELTVKSGSVHLTIQSVQVDAENTLVVKVPWYKRPLSSFFRDQTS